MDKPRFVYVSYINTTPEKLWKALTTPEFTRQYWFGSDIESDWKVGSPVRFENDGTVNHDQVVLECDPPRRLSYTWHPLFTEEMTKERPSKVTFEIEAPTDHSGNPAKAVKLTVTHDDFPADSVIFPMISNGWPAVLSNLKSLLESGRAMDLDFIKCGSDKTKK